jgi:hypothetical protein
MRARDVADPDFLDPGPHDQRVLILSWIALAFAGALIVLWLKPALLAHVNALPVCDQLPWWRAFLVGALCAPVVVALWAVHYARKLLRYEQMPLPGTRVLRRTPIVRGRPVRLRAWLLIAVAAIAVLVSVACSREVMRTPIFDTRIFCASPTATPHA